MPTGKAVDHVLAHVHSATRSPLSAQASGGCRAHRRVPQGPSLVQAGPHTATGYSIAVSTPRSRPERPTGPDASLPVRLRGRWLLLARTAWIAVAVLALGLFAAGIPAEFTLLHIPCPTVTCPTGQLPPAGLHALQDLGLSLDSFAAYSVAMDVVFAAVCGAVAALVFWRKSDDRMALFVSLALLTFGTSTFTFTMAALAVRHPAWETPVAFLHFLGAASFGLFVYLFPDGRFVPRWTRWVALVWIASQLPRYFFPDWYADPNTWYDWISGPVWLVALSIAIYGQVHRYRHTSSSVQRQQIKWVVFGISAALAGFLGIELVLGEGGTVPRSPGALVAYLVGYTFIGYLAVLLIPASIGIAVLRHHLFDVDLVINRTLVYGSLTAMLALVYLGGVVSLQYAFRTLTGQGSQIAIVASTLAIAALFNPLRRRIQGFIDRSFYRRKYDARKTLEAFSAKLREEPDLDALNDELLTVVRQTMQPAHVSLWLHPDPALKDKKKRADIRESGHNK
jgi:hypothetical protein